MNKRLFPFIFFLIVGNITLTAQEQYTVEEVEIEGIEEINERINLMNQKQMISSATVEGAIKEINDEEVIVSPQPTPRQEVIFKACEQMPIFSGGQDSLMRYISSNLRYPAQHVETNIQGRVVVRFVVRKDGTISDIEVVRSLDPACDKEAVRIIRQMPKWKPGKQNEQPVSVYYTLPIRFTPSQE